MSYLSFGTEIDNFLKKNLKNMKNKLIDYRDSFGGLLETFDTLLNNGFEYPYYRGLSNAGKVNINATDKDYVVDISVPGFSKEELKIDFTDGILMVEGEHKVESNEEKKNYSRKEFSKKSFCRSFRIPDNVTSEIDAKLENGILSISLKKKELPPKQEPKKIEIK
jgi:HSP20 family protein